MCADEGLWMRGPGPGGGGGAAAPERSPGSWGGCSGPSSPGAPLMSSAAALQHHTTCSSQTSVDKYRPERERVTPAGSEQRARLNRVKESPATAAAAWTLRQPQRDKRNLSALGNYRNHLINYFCKLFLKVFLFSQMIWSKEKAEINP